MAVDKLVDSNQLNSDLTDVADAIRAKSGGTSPLHFPEEYITEIQAIPTGGGGGLSFKTGSYTFASDYKITKSGQHGWNNSAIVIATGLSDIKMIAFYIDEMLQRDGTPARPFVADAIWYRPEDMTSPSNYVGNSVGVAGGFNVSSANWNGVSINGATVIGTHELNSHCPAGSFGVFAYNTSYFFKAGSTLIWEAIGTE